MTHNPTRQAALLVVIAVLLLTAAPLGYAQADPTPMLHAAGLHGPGCSGGAPTVTTCNAGMDQGMTGMSTSMPARTPPAVDMQAFDLHFIDLMIAHHESAIAMATVVIEESTDPVLVGLAGDIIAAQTEEIATLKEWRNRWYRTSPPSTTVSTPGMTNLDHLHMMGIMEPDAAARALRTAPETVDRAFANAMILHHQGVTMMFEMAVLHAAHPELAGLAGVMLEAHHEQVVVMQDWQLA